MDIQKFYDWLDLSAQAQIKKIKPRPYLSEITSVMVQRGETCLYYTENYNFENVRKFEFLRIKIKKKWHFFTSTKNGTPGHFNRKKK